MARMAETKDLAQLRLLNLELLRQLWAGQDAMRQSVVRAASESILDSSGYCKSETPLSPEMTPSPQSFPKASCSQDSHQGSTCGSSCCGRTFLPPATHRHLEPLGGQRPHLAPSPATEGLKETSRRTEDLGPQETEGLRSALPQPSRRSKARVTFCQESAMPESSWRFRPYLGYDWIAGALDNSSQITGEPDFFFSTLQKFREANKEECVCSSPEAVFPGLQESSDKEEEDHQCVYCYRVNRRLFPVPVDPGTPCRLCGISRDQRDTEARVEPAQVRVSIPLSNLDPPHQYQIHRRKSYDSSDTLALPRHCLLGWDILPPKSEKNSAPENLDLWSSVTSRVQCQLSAANPSCLALPAQVLARTPIWSKPQVDQLHNLH